MSELKATKAAVEILKRDLTKQDEIIEELADALKEIYDAWPGRMIRADLEFKLLEKVGKALKLKETQDE